MKQTSFWKKPKLSHGGALSKGKRKAARPLVTKSPIHICFKSSRAKGAWSFHRYQKPIEEEIYKIAERFRVRIRLYQNVGNHLHLVVQGASRRGLQNFLRVVPQAVMFLVTKARKGASKGKFWDGLVFTRIVQWGRDWGGIKKYVEKNRIEAAGVPRHIVDKWFEEAQMLWAGEKGIVL